MSIPALSWAHPPFHEGHNSNIHISGTINLPSPIDITINNQNRHHFQKVWIPGHWERRHEQLVYFSGYWEYIPKEHYRPLYYGKGHWHNRGQHYACAREYYQD